MNEYIIRLENIIGGEPLSSALQQTEEWYTQQIAKAQKRLENIEHKYRRKLKAYNNILNNDVKNFTKKDKLVLYKTGKKNYSRAVIANKINAQRGQTPLNLPQKPRSIKDLTDEDFAEYQKSFKTSFLCDHGISDVKNEIDKINQNRKSQHIVAIDKNEIFNNLPTVKNICQQLLADGKKVVLVIDQDMKAVDNNAPANYVYTKQQFEALSKLSADISSDNFSINFLELNHINNMDAFGLHQTWKFEDVVKANQQIDSVVKEIKDRQLSPYEAMLYIHNYVSMNFRYNPNNTLPDRSDADCTIMGATKNLYPTILCAGYSSVTKAIIDKLGYKDLSCQIMGCDLYKKRGPIHKFDGGHSHCLITIKDDKYNIDGKYINDACWDSAKLTSLAHCMYPIGDLMHMKDFIYSQSFKGSSRFDNVKYNYSDVAKSIGSNAVKNVINNIKTNLHDTSKKYVPDVVNMYADHSKPIPLETTCDALAVVLQEKYIKLTDESIKNEITRRIQKSVETAIGTFDTSASSQYVKLALKQKLCTTNKQKSLNDYDNGNSY